MVRGQAHRQSQHARHGLHALSAIASNLAKGYSLSESVARAKEYISGALSAMLDLGKGAGPMQHNFDLRGEFAKENTK